MSETKKNNQLYVCISGTIFDKYLMGNLKAKNYVDLLREQCQILFVFPEGKMIKISVRNHQGFHNFSFKKVDGLTQKEVGYVMIPIDSSRKIYDLRISEYVHI